MTQQILLAKNLEKTIANDDLFEGNMRRRTLWKIDSIEMNRTGLYLLAGRNGAGKSTLLRCLLGLVKPTRGEVRWFGETKIKTGGLGYVPEFPILPPAVKVRRFLQWMTSCRDLEALRKSIPCLQSPFFALDDVLDVPTNRLSKGQQQRVQLWHTLASNPQGLVLDEPFSGLDPWARQDLSTALCTLLQEEKFILMSSHEVTKQLRQVCSETWLLEKALLTAKPGCVLPE